MNNRKYPPGPEIETIERLMKKRDDLQEENNQLRILLRQMPEWVWDEEIAAFTCPICLNGEVFGHLPDCKLARERIARLKTKKEK